VNDTDRMWIAFALCAGTIIAAAFTFAGCDPFVGTATHSTDPHLNDTDCHNGTWCPPSAPFCTGVTLSNGSHCEAAQDPPAQTWIMRRKDAGAL
jgi:hypothetical protein